LGNYLDIYGLWMGFRSGNYRLFDEFSNADCFGHRIISRAAFGKKPNGPPSPEAVTAMARNPPANRQMLSPAPCGVFLGARGNQYVVKPENMDGHVLVAGIPGSGKSSCIAIPTLRSWRGSVFAIDIKGELYENTKQYRQNIKFLYVFSSRRAMYITMCM
jgi:hypothetical protein